MMLRALGKACGIAWQMIGFYEQGRVEPKRRTLAELLRVLGTEWLVGGPRGPLPEGPRADRTGHVEQEN
jgi:hypothetical protein